MVPACLPGARLQDGKQVEQPVELAQALGIGQARPAQLQVLPHAHGAEQLAAFRALHDAAARHRGRGAPSQRATAPADGAGVGHQAGDRVEQRGLAGAVQPDDRDEFTFLDVDRHVIERLRLAVEDADILHLEQRRPGPGLDRLAGRSLDRAAEIDPAHLRVGHHLGGAALGDMLAQVHRQHAVHQGGYALHVVVHQQHGAALGAEAGDQLGEVGHLPGGQPGERLVHQHHLRARARSPWPVPAGAGRRTAASPAAGRTPRPARRAPRCGGRRRPPTGRRTA